MSAILKSKDLNVLRRFIPLNTLSEERFNRLIDDLVIEPVEKGGLVFEQGDDKKEFIYLISGKISLYAGEMEMEVIATDSEAARFAIAHQLPRKVRGVAKTKSRVVRVPTSKLDQEKPQKPAETYMVNEEESEGGDWMATMLQSPVFQKLPAANLQKVMMKMEEVAFEPGETVVKQGDSADYYYIIKRGTCELTRESAKGAKPIKLAELHDCASFGEDALLSDAPRNVTVTMKGAGQLLRLTKDDFITLVKEPVLQYVNIDEARDKVSKGGVWLDVRETDLYQANHIEGSHNIPFFSLRMKVSTLKHDQAQLLVCEDGRTSEAAAFLLLKFGFNACILKGGMAAYAKAAQGDAKSADAPEETTGVNEQAPAAISENDLLDVAQSKIDELEKLCACFNEEQNKTSLERDALQKDRDRQLELATVSQESLALYKEQVELLENSQVNLKNSQDDALKRLDDEKVLLVSQLDDAKTKLLKVEESSGQNQVGMDALQQQCEQLSSDLDSKNQQIEQQHVELENVQKNLLAKEQKVGEQLSSSDEEKQQLLTDKTQLKSEIGALNEALKTLQTENNQLEKVLEDGKELHHQSDEKITTELKSLALAKESADKRNDELEEQNTMASAQLIELKQELEALRQAVKESAVKDNINQAKIDEYDVANQQNVVALEELSSKNKMLEGEAESRIEKLELQQNTLVEAERDSVELEKEKADLVAENEVISSQLHELESSASAGSKEYANKTAELDRLINQLASLQAVDDENKVTISGLNQHLSDAKQERDDKNKMLVDAERVKAELEKEKTALAAENKGITNQLRELEKTALAGLEEHASKSAEVEHLVSELASLKISDDESKTIIKGLDQRLINSQKELEAAQKAMEHVQREMDKERDNHAALKQELELAQKSLQDSAGTMEMLAADKQSMEDLLKQQLSELKNQIILEQEAKGVAIEALGEANASGQRSSTSVESLNEKLHQLTDEKKMDAERIEELEQASVELSEVISESNKAKKRLELRLVETEESQSAEANKIAALESELLEEKTVSEGRYQDIKESLQASQKEAGDLSLKLDELLDVNATMTNDNSDLEQKVALYEQNKQALTDNIKSLESKLSQPDEKDNALVTIQSLERQLDEAKTALVDMEIKLDNMESNVNVGTESEDSELLAVKSELLLVREQTEGDIQAMKEMLDSSAKMNMALKKELLTLQAVANQQSLEEPPKKKKGLWK
ncbi:MAG: hypothetical protein COB26_04675 [Piscirickettsiaceae bacterium]|nr:MAG: hypothetical protein COB26_04675 [Piscirickettsiaceae bacterium]